MRATLAMTLGLGLILAGCGPTASEPLPGTIPVAKAPPPTNDPIGPPMGMQAAPGGGGGPAGKAARPPRGGASGKSGGEAAPASTKPDEPKNPPAAAGVTLTDEEIAEIKTLPEADQKAALAQKICLVGEDEGKPNHLGSMGKPIKVAVKGKTVFLCCKGCVSDLMSDPDKYLSKLGK